MCLRLKLLQFYWSWQIKFNSVYSKVCCDQVLQTILTLCSMALLRCCSWLANLVSKPIRSICFTAAGIRIQPYTTHKPFLLWFPLFPPMFWRCLKKCSCIKQMKCEVVSVYVLLRFQTARSHSMWEYFICTAWFISVHQTRLGKVR